MECSPVNSAVYLKNKSSLINYLHKSIENDEVQFLSKPCCYSLQLFYVRNQLRELLLYLCVHAQLLQSYPTLCNPVDCSPSGSSLHGILQARILERVAMPSSTRSSQPKKGTRIFWGSCIACRFFTAEEVPLPWEVHGFA